MSTRGEIETTYTKSGLPRYSIEVRHDPLNKYQIIRGDNQYVVQQKAEAKMAQWDEMWRRKQAAESAAEKTREAQSKLTDLERVLVHALAADNTVDWEALKNKKGFSVPKPSKPAPSKGPSPPHISKEPMSSDRQYEPILDIFDRIIIWLGIANAKVESAQSRFDADHKRWVEEKERAERKYKEEKQAHEKLLEEQETEYLKSVAEWDKSKKEYTHECEANNLIIDKKKEVYLQGELEGVLDYCDMVLASSQYPKYFPQSYKIDYNPDGKVLVLDYQLPNKVSIPTVRQVRYVQSRDEFIESHLPKTQFNKLYDSLLYQTALRTLHELFEADVVGALNLIVFNGIVKSVDPATGQEKVACVLSVQANKKEFESINLDRVEPKACFKNLKGISSSRLYNLTPIAPILRIEREDKRFVSSYDVADDLGEEYNLAAMDWEDFEHLVREVFEKEFKSTGGEVKVTRASRDGGIDVVAFDPDPIRGGKLIIQAKRYTNTVDVSAVRDLYGSVINEGAAKGILVTTSDYGPDSYKFARGKPLTLLNGNNLLHLLEKHGHRAKIDIQEAKRIMAEKSN